MNTKNLKIGTTIVTILGLGVNLALNWLEEKEREEFVRLKVIKRQNQSEAAP